MKPRDPPKEKISLDTRRNLKIYENPGSNPNLVNLHPPHYQTATPPWFKIAQIKMSDAPRLAARDRARSDRRKSNETRDRGFRDAGRVATIEHTLDRSCASRVTRQSAGSGSVRFTWREPTVTLHWRRRTPRVCRDVQLARLDLLSPRFRRQTEGRGDLRGKLARRQPSIVSRDGIECLASIYEPFVIRGFEVSKYPFQVSSLVFLQVHSRT